MSKVNEQLARAIKHYRSLDMFLLPTVYGAKMPFRAWTDGYYKEAEEVHQTDENEGMKMFNKFKAYKQDNVLDVARSKHRKNEPYNLAFVANLSGITVLDCDTTAAVQQFESILNKLGVTVPTVKTQKGKHFYFKAEKEFMRDIRLTPFNGVEVDVKGKRLVTLPPSCKIADGVTTYYKWEIPLLSREQLIPIPDKIKEQLRAWIKQKEAIQQERVNYNVDNASFGRKRVTDLAARKKAIGVFDFKKVGVYKIITNGMPEQGVLNRSETLVCSIIPTLRKAGYDKEQILDILLSYPIKDYVKKFGVNNVKYELNKYFSYMEAKKKLAH